MRDLQHLEELSAATGFGSWANDVVVALDRVHGGHGLPPTDRQVLLQAAELLSALADPGPLHRRPDTARSLAASETTRTALAAVLGREHVEGQSAALRDLAAAANEAARGDIAEDRRAAIESLITIFDKLGDLQLVRSTSVLTSRKDGLTWTAMRPT